MRRQINAIFEESIKINIEGEPLKLTPNQRKFLNKKLQGEFGKGYFPSIPIKEIFAVLKQSYIIPVQEDGIEWSGFLMGDKSHTQFDLVMYDDANGEYRPIKNSVLVMSWYKMDSGRYEINCYMS